MDTEKYRTAPQNTDRMPGGIPYIVGNEAAERFSYYGMRAILVTFMTQYLMNHSGGLDVMSEEKAKSWYHLFVGSAYFFPLLGGMLADAFWGKYRTILILSIVYCLGHLALALDSSRVGLTIGLTLIAIGAGGIKPCVSAHVGDQFGPANQHLIQRAFGWFYLAINLGAVISMLLTPWLLENERFGPHWAFGVPGGLMLLATIVFWWGRREFAHIPPTGARYFGDTFNLRGLKYIGKLAIIYFFVAAFWALYDQTGSSWVTLGEKLNPRFLGVTWLSAQMQAVNPALILVLVPAFTYVVYPAMEKKFRATPLRKIGIGLFVMVLSFLITGWVQSRVDAGETPSIGWLVLANVPLTAAEVMVSVVCLEFSYTQAPKHMKSLIMGLYFLSVTAGNYLAAFVNYFIANEDGTSKLPGASYFWFFSGLMFAAAVAFTITAKFYQEETFVHEAEE